MQYCSKTSASLACPSSLSLLLLPRVNSSLTPSSSCRFHWLTWIVLRPLIASMATLALNSGLWVRRLRNSFGEGVDNGGSPFQGRYPASDVHDGCCPEKPDQLSLSSPRPLWTAGRRQTAEALPQMLSAASSWLACQSCQAPYWSQGTHTKTAPPCQPGPAIASQVSNGSGNSAPRGRPTHQ